MDLQLQQNILNLKLKNSLDHFKNNTHHNIKLLKLNTKKLPGDFFGKSSKSSRKVNENCFINRAVVSNQKVHRNDPINNIQNNQETLAQAKVTSFFKMAEVSQTTDVTELGQKDKFLSERKFSLKLKKEKSPLNDQEVTASIELKPEMNDESLCCTFSKNINMQYVANTPLKKEEAGQRMKKVNSVTMQRTPNIPTVPKQRKGSLYQNQDKIQTPRQFVSHESVDKIKKVSQPLFLPKINRIH